MEITDFSTLLSGAHGRQRREERNIEKIDLQRAKRYGMKEKSHTGRDKYTYGGIVFIYDPRRKREVTSFPSSDKSCRSSGTKCTEPIILNKKYVETHDLLLHSNQIKTYSDRNSFSKWSSHSVLVVDMSGSMRKDDVNGARCRSDGVWMTLARDYVQKPLEAKTRSAEDLISVVVMRDIAEVVLYCEPTSWVLYNKLIDLREWSSIRPSGPGNYLPAIKLAEELLMLNQSGNCSLSVLFFSDGRPSDRGDFAGRIGQLASIFGRRLSIACIGMAEEGEDFSTLNAMVTEATSYGAIATFKKPTLDADSLSNIISSLATSLTTTITEITEISTGKPKTIRIDVKREKIGTPDDIMLTSNWISYPNNDDKYVRRIWVWSYKKDNFVQLIDTRCYSCWKQTCYPMSLCPICNGCCFCDSCKLHDDHAFQHRGCYAFRQKVSTGSLVYRKTPSFSVAMKKQAFGEGAERFAFKFRFLDERNNFNGPFYVAKESRFLLDEHAYKERMDYHKDFMRTQSIANEMAVMFNKALDDLAYSYDPKLRELLANLPRISFLSPFVVEVDDNGEEKNFLVEKMLQGRYIKFNNNMGCVGHQFSVNELTDSLKHLRVDELDNAEKNLVALDAIAEESQEEEDDNEDDKSSSEALTNNSTDCISDLAKTTDILCADLSEKHFPQAFSHFTFEKSKKHLIVVDL